MATHWQVASTPSRVQNWPLVDMGRTVCDRLGVGPMTKPVLDVSGMDFGEAMKAVTKGLIVKPILQTYLYDAKFPAFDLHFPKQEMERRPDSWFHPSTHPMLNERVLYYYLNDVRFPVEKKKYMSTLSVTIGKVMHEFIQMCLTDAGLRPLELQRCTTCPPGAGCKEYGVSNSEVGERGHLDGVLDLAPLAHIPRHLIRPVLEFKTTGPGNLRRFEDMDLEAFRRKWPEYWAQQQRYQHLSGFPYSIVLFLETGYPWEMREIHVPYDPAWNAMIDAKYKRVRQAVADGRAPMACCGSKRCLVAPLCDLEGDHNVRT